MHSYVLEKIGVSGNSGNAEYYVTRTRAMKRFDELIESNNSGIRSACSYVFRYGHKVTFVDGTAILMREITT